VGVARRWTAALLLVFQPAFAAAQPPHGGVIEGTVTTQQSTALAAADVTIVDAAGRIVASVSSENDGRFRVANLPAGTYRVIAALDGFTTTTKDVVVSVEASVVVALDMPIAGFSDTVDVVGAPAALANGQTLAPTAAVASRELDQFVPGQGVQGAVRLLPNVVPVAGGVSIKGGRPSQAGLQLAAMTLVDPASGVSRVTLPDDAIESVTVLPNPYAVEYGRFSSGLVVIQSRRARDRWKFRANRFGPSIRSRNDGGLRFEAFNPRLEVGGPLVADRMFLEQTAQVRFQVGDLASRPESEQRVTKALSSFTRLDTNVSRRHLLVATVGLFPSVVESATIGTFVPPEASVNFRMHARQLSLTDRALWSDRLFGETTFQWYDSRTDVEPQGDLPMELQPDTILGNFFNRQHRTTSSYQIVHVLTAHREGFGGSHLLKAGVDVMHTQYDGTSESHAVLIERADGAVVRRLDFSGPATVQAVGATEAAVFAQDRVQVHPRWYVEAGMRVDRDGVLRRVNLSPRVGTAVMLSESGSAVLRGGWGVFVERTPSMAGAFTTFEGLVDTRYDRSVPLQPDAVSIRVTNTVAPFLETPVSNTWDAAFDYRLNPRWAFRVGTMRREGRHELIVAPTIADSGVERRLSSDGRSSYRDVEFAAQYTRGASVDVEATYTRSHSEGDLNVLTNYYDVVLAPVVPDNVYARLWTDVPHRLLVRGRVMPAPKWLLLGVFDWRTGLPYSVVNEALDFVGARNELRFPNYCRLELGVERRIKILKFQPWVGVRFTNVLGHFLPEDVQNNTGSPSFGTFYNAEPRRLRLQVRFER
jgi:outer membrane receptor protein involved in Fe transport